ncbi:MAG: hypothetical protein VX656_12730 [Candidatus Latescibacterota bacterium]|nr:hypothetical protein [Candidatus Latescibacterota bacterium]
MDGRIILGEGIVEFDGEVTASDLILEGEDLPIDAEGTDPVTYFG